MQNQLASRSAEERARGLTLVGPHRDDIAFTVEGHEARAYASQGQTRTIALAWKLAEVAVIKEIAEEAPVLLLDDVMSELDEARRHALAAFVGGAAQTFMTTTNLGYFEKELVARAKVVEVG
jgi:DNA replication and repair protein RecF